MDEDGERVDPETAPIGRRIRNLREGRGWNQARLAREAGLTPSAVSRVESGKRQAVLSETLRKIAGALGVSVDYLQGSDVPEPTDRELVAILEQARAADLPADARAAIKSYLRYVLEDVRRRATQRQSGDSGADTG